MSSWELVRHLPDKVRNMVRRGYLLATYNDGLLLKARVNTGVDIENDQLDVLNPVGFVSHVAPGDKVEVFTLDVGADASRRVVLSVIGDRATHPKPDEGEAFFYAPGDPTRYLRLKKAGGAASHGQTRNSGRAPGFEISVGDIPVEIHTDETVTIWARKVRIEGDLEATGEITARVDGGAVNLSSHTHRDAGGEGNSGPPNTGG